MRLTGKRSALSVLLLVVFTVSAWASPTTSQQALQVVQGWLSRNAVALGTRLSSPTDTVAPYNDSAGQPAYYIVSLSGQGFVIVPADDAIEPILGFSSNGTYEAVDANPLFTLVSRDVAGRLAAVRAAGATQAKVAAAGEAALEKWRALTAAATGATATKGSRESVSDVRVSPLTKTTWSQSNDTAGAHLYNIYTPNNYVTGCTATAMAQLMRFHQFPVASVPTNTYTVRVDGSAHNMTIRGGDGSGGPYRWSLMTLSPNTSTPTANREAISALMADAGASVHMQYTATSSGAWYSASSYTTQFGYASARSAWSDSGNMPSDSWMRMLNPDLDAGLPVNLAVFTATMSAGHSIVCDGYGYDTATLYHHMNVGWGGYKSIWYNLPTVDTGSYTFTLINQTIYNLFPYGSGEIVSGRITDASGNPVRGARLTATRAGGGTATTTTDFHGIYAFKNIPSATTLTLHAAKPGYTFTDSQVTLGTSVDGTTTVGNVWGGAADFQATAITDSGAASKIAVGGSHMLALAADGTVWACGDNSAGQLGTGDTVNHLLPVKITSLPAGTPARDVAAGRNHSLVLLADGTVWAFGANTAGQLGLGATMDATPHPTPTQIPGLTAITGLGAGASDASLASNPSGLWTFGDNASGQLGTGDTTNRNTPVLALAGTAETAIAGGAMGPDHALVVLSDGQVSGVGANDHGQLGTGDTTARTSLGTAVVGLTGVRQVVAGDGFSLAVKTDGLVYGFGADDVGQLGTGDATGADQTQPVLVPGLAQIETLSAGNAFALTRKADGTVQAFGDNTAGQLGQGTTGGFSRTPVTVSGPGGVILAAAGGASGLVHNQAGNVWAFGGNSAGQLGTGNTTNRSTAVQIAFNIESPRAGGPVVIAPVLLLLLE